MDFLKKSPRFSFLLNGEKAAPESVRQTQEGNTLVTVYRYPGGLTVTEYAVKYPDFDGYEWYHTWENTGASPTGILSDIKDCDAILPMQKKPDVPYTGYILPPEEMAVLFVPTGSCYAIDTRLPEFYAAPVFMWRGKKYTYASAVGRSTAELSPYFRVQRKTGGVIGAVGWSGNWQMNITETETGVSVEGGLRKTAFRLLPGEKVRTASFVFLHYDGDGADGQNKWRRFVRAHFCPIGRPGRPEHLPLFFGVWGGTPDAVVLPRIEEVKKAGYPLEYLWMDAGWYGMSEKPCPDDATGDWSDYVGDFRCNPQYHPGGLSPVAEAAGKAGMKFLLWFEPERVSRKTPVFTEHPEWILDAQDPWHNLLLNIGREEAYAYCYENLCRCIEDFHITCVRQDFNMAPAAAWAAADGPERIGMTEIKYIGNLYRLWDALCARFPYLWIDNCASGGRRLDIEALRRTVPLWRSDAMCPVNYNPEVAQSHALAYGAFLPYSGTGAGRTVGDMYRFRSAYAPGLTGYFSYAETARPMTEAESAAFLRVALAEYLRVRPYLSEDMYPLTSAYPGPDGFCAVQYHRPAEGDGILQVFRREKSPYTTAELALRALQPEQEYYFEDADGKENFTVTGREAAAGLAIRMSSPRLAKLWFYRKAGGNK